MINPEIEREIMQQLHHLPADLQRRVLNFAYALALSLPKGAPGKDMLQFSGIMEKDDAQEIHRAIEEGCERVDASEW